MSTFVVRKNNIKYEAGDLSDGRFHRLSTPTPLQKEMSHNILLL